MTNVAVTFVDATAHATREGEVSGAAWDDGMNNGSCMPGIGIAIGPDGFTGDPAQWTLLDQAGAARDPQDGQSLGGVGLGAGDASVQPYSEFTNDTSGDGSGTEVGPVDLLALVDGWTSQP